MSETENNLTIAFTSITGHVSVGYKAVSTISPFKQPKCALELQLLNF